MINKVNVKSRLVRKPHILDRCHNAAISEKRVGPLLVSSLNCKHLAVVNHSQISGNHNTTIILAKKKEAVIAANNHNTQHFYSSNSK